jgi:shikimate kinase
MNERMRLTHEFRDLFSDEARKRSERTGHSEETGELIWVVMEAETMLKRVNEHRLMREKKAISKDLYELMEQRCMGHSDYHMKLAIGCVELVLDKG